MTGGDLFFSTAMYYSKFRPRYPDGMLQDLLRMTVGDHGRHLVDWGCGSGEVALPLSASFDRVTAIDLDPEMVEVARARAADVPTAQNVEWHVGRAEDLVIEPGSCDLITAGSSFHWMDRELLSKRAFEGLTDDGAIALIGGGSSVWDENAPWHSIAVRCLRKHLGDSRRAGSGTYAVTKKHGDYLVPAGFRLENHDYPTEHAWTVDEIIGYLYSTSFAGRHVLGDKQDVFERDLREALDEAEPSGIHHEQLDFYLIVGFKR